MFDEDGALAQRAAGGDAVAFEVLVRRHSDDVWRFAFGMLQDRGAAEDAAQETFIKMHRALSTFRGDASFKTWTLSIARRTCLDALRKRRAPVVPLDEVRERRNEAVEAETRVALDIAVAALPDDERDAFMFVDVLGVTREDAAGILGVPASTLKSRLARAHAALVSELSGTTQRKRARRAR